MHFKMTPEGRLLFTKVERLGREKGNGNRKRDGEIGKHINILKCITSLLAS